MSQITNRIATVYTANAGNAIAVQGQIAGGMQNIARQSQAAARQGGILNNQLRAIGTTMRYMVAGSLIFGAGSMVRTLRDTQKQLALIRAIGGGAFDPTAVGAEKANQALDNLYTNAMRGSLGAITPVSEFNDALVNLYSTVQGLDAKPAIAMTTAIARGAQLAQVSAEDMTRAVAGMTQAFDPDQHTAKGYGRFIRGFTELTMQAPGGIAYGPQFIQQMAPLAAVSRFASISPSQMMGLYLTTLRTGGTPATAGRGLQYLLQSIAVPASDEAGKALKRAGVTPSTVQEPGHGGVWALRQVMQHARGLGIKGEGKIGQLTDEQIQILEEQGAGPEALKGLGISGPGLAFLSEAIGRIHGIRALVTLMAQGPQRMDQDMQIMREAMSDTAQATEEFRKRWENFANDQPLQAASVSLDIARREIASAFEPFINFGAKNIARAAPTLMDHENDIQKGIVAGSVGLGAYGLARKFRGKSFGLGRAVPVAAAAMSLTGGETGLGTFTNPMFVVVVNDIFGGKVPPVIPGGDKADDIAKKGRLARFGPWALAAGAGAARWVGKGAEGLMNRGMRLPGRFPMATSLGLRGVPLVGAAANALINPDEAGGGISGNEQMTRAGLNFSRAQQLNPNVQRLFNTKENKITGQVTLDVLVKQPDGTTERKRIHVPVKQWNYPQYRGQGGKTNRRN